jgi:cytochrome c oxidase assembly protein subunit 15
LSVCFGLSETNSVMGSRRVHWLAVATAGSAFLLIVAGALVTSRDAGLAVPDWPLAFGELNPPRWWQIENVRTEHGHRIIAFLVASLTAFLAWSVRRVETRPAVRSLAAAAAGLVVLQALLGGLRVLALSVDLAMVHGWLGQMFFATLVSLAVVTSPTWTTTSSFPTDRRTRNIALLFVGGVVTQLVVGIVLRHLGASARPLMENGLFYVHVVAGLAVAALTFALRQSTNGNVRLRRTATWGCVLVCAQIALGLVTFLVTETMQYDRQATFAEAWIPTLHVAVGAGLLAVAMSSVLVAWRDSLPFDARPLAADQTR